MRINRELGGEFDMKSLIIMPFTTKIEEGRDAFGLKGGSASLHQSLINHLNLKKANLFIQKIRINIHLNRYKLWQTKVDLN